MLRIDKDLPLVRGLSRKQHAKVEAVAKEATLERGEVLTREGETAKKLFALLSGSLEVLRRDRRGTEYVVGDLKPGELIGEQGAAVEGRSRAVTIRATEPCKVLVLPKDVLETEPRLLANVARAMASRLRVKSALSLEHAQERAAMGELLIKSLVLLCGYAVLLSALPWLRATWPSASTTYISLPVIALFGYSSVRFLRSTGWPLSRFGLGFRNLIGSLFESTIFTPIFAVLLVGLKWSLIRIVPGWRETLLFEHTDIAARLADPDIRVLLIIYAASALVQELIVRCALQASLEDFLSGRGRTVAPIVAAALMFSVNHLHMSFIFAAMAFIPGLFWGWMFHRKRHLLGVTLSHFAIGAFVFFVLGVRLQ